LTYKGYAGFARMFAYLGDESHALDLELRQGRQHSQNRTGACLRSCIGQDQRIVSSAHLLCRMTLLTMQRMPSVEAHIKLERKGGASLQFGREQRS